MEKTVIGLVAAIGATIPFAGAQASVVSSEDAARALQVSSVADLLEPVANSAAILEALDQNEPAPAAAPAKGVQVVQWHHHHHHHHFYHHHHHHHHWYYRHHHHHHHHWYRRGCMRTPVGWVCP